MRGTVQGVGFRPFVHRRATALGLTGWVSNDGEGVLIEVEGDLGSLDHLELDLSSQPPPLARVDAVEASPLPLSGHVGFVIRPTSGSAHVDVPVSADAAPCAACLDELADPANRRFGYPFINCTDCGPRLTIVTDVPYDRPSTTMAAFRMCAPCQREYDDPVDRRFHAQPNACAACGPQLRWRSGSEAVDGPAAVTAAAACLRAGGTIGIKGVGGYHLACDATSSSAVAELRARKRRPAKPLAVMVADEAAARGLVELSLVAAAALTSTQRPVLLAPLRKPAAIDPQVAPGLAELGVMLPSSPLHVLLLGAVDRPLVMTSGNLVDEPIAHDDADALARLGPLVDGLLTHDRVIHVPVDDSVVRVVSADRLQLVRRARGWTPRPLYLPVAADRTVLAVGAQLKSTVALAREHSLVVSQHLGDVENWSTHVSFVRAIEHLSRLARTAPDLVVHDLHPDYPSTAWAARSGLPSLAVQHHHAHIASCLVEHGRSSPVLGIAFDGTGLGTDGTLWGGELLIADLTGFRRVGHLLPVPLPGGDAAVREPWRMALSWLEASIGPDAAARWGASVDDRAPAVLGLVRSGSQPLTSSAGRLFDAVSALLGVRSRVSYEGQAAAELEAVARLGGPGGGAYELPSSEGVLDPRPLLAGLWHGLQRGAPVEQLAADFHVGLSSGVAALAVTVAADAGVDTVALSGGVFQNALLSDLLSASLRAAGLQVLLHEQVPPNDGGISTGQAAIAAASLAAGIAERVHVNPQLA